MSPTKVVASPDASPTLPKATKIAEEQKKEILDMVNSKKDTDPEEEKKKAEALKEAKKKKKEK